jgi:thiol-disulfide isomerase/thioredoxin
MRALVLVVALLLSGWPVRAHERAADAVRALDVTDLDGTHWRPSRLRGRVTLIDFWATWCAPCLTDLPLLKQTRARYSRDEFEVLGVSFDVSDRRTFISWMNRQGIEWPQVFDSRGARGVAARLFGVHAVPATFLIGADGEVVATNLRGTRLMTAIDEQVRLLRASR